MRTHTNDTNWEPLIPRLKALWYERPQLSTQQIADRLGVSKNAVVGKVHRLDDLEPRPSPIKKKEKPQAKRTIRRQAAQLAPLPSVQAAMPAAPKPVFVAPEPRQAEPTPIELRPPPVPRPHVPCQWPVNDRTTRSGYALSCEASAEVGKPYCLDHCIAGFVSYRPRAAA